jgi:hypothetical protein
MTPWIFKDLAPAADSPGQAADSPHEAFESLSQGPPAVTKKPVFQSNIAPPEIVNGQISDPC